MYGCFSTSSIAACGVSVTGSPTTSGRGTITSSTSVSENWKTLFTISCSSASILPSSFDAATRRFSSSSEWASELSRGSGRPRMRAVATASQSRNQMNGRKQL